MSGLGLRILPDTFRVEDSDTHCAVTVSASPAHRLTSSALWHNSLTSGRPQSSIFDSSPRAAALVEVAAARGGAYSCEASAVKKS